MPKSPKHFAVSRQWQILQLIPLRAPGMSARQLVGELEQIGIHVSKRTVERDLNELSLVFDLCTVSMGNDNTQGWYFASNRVPSIGSIDYLDAIMLVLAGDVLDQMLPKEAYSAISSRIEKARDKLKGMERSPLANWIHKVSYVPPSIVQQRPKVDSAVLRNVQRALVQEKQLQIRYRPFGRSWTDYQLHPLALILRGPVLYLAATAFDYTDVRLYGLHRIRRASLTELPVVVPEDFSLEEYIEGGAMGFWTKHSIQLKAEISKAFAQLMEESPIAKDQRIEEMDGRIILSATVRESWQLETWILSHCSDMTVREPAELRDRIRIKLQEAVFSYDRASSGASDQSR